MALPLASTTRKGIALSFGAITLTVNVHSAVGDDSSRKLKNVCLGGHDVASTGKLAEPHAPSPIKQRRFCPVCDDDNAANFIKAQEVPDGYVPIPQDIIDLEKAAASGFSTGMAITMHPMDEVFTSMIPSGKSYYLSLPPSNMDGPRKAYSMLSWLIRNKPETAFMTRFTLRTAVSVFQLTTAGPGTLVLRQMADAELVRDHPDISFIELSQAEMDLATAVADMTVEPFLTGTHGSGKTNIIADYAATQPAIAGSEPVLDGRVSPAAEPIDLIGGLQATLAAASLKAVPAAPEQDKVPAPRKAAVKKAPAKKAPAKKATTTTTRTRTAARKVS